MASANPRWVPGRSRQPALPRREYWRALIAECGRSGLSQAEFCRRRAIPPGTLSCWKHKLSREARRAQRPSASVPAPPAPLAFLPVRVTGPQPPRGEPTPGATAGAGELEIALESGRLVRVRGRVDAQWLGQVIVTLEASRC
jgi:hypothetical protein